MKKHILFLFSLAFLTLTNSLIAQGTAFTYQGQLQTGGSPANGNYDFTFALYNNSNTNPPQLGATLTDTNVGVTNGLFTVTLDFGSVFTGNATWLAIAVRTNGGAGFTALSPLQELTPTPYAIYTPNAGTAASATSVAAANIVGTVSASQLPSSVITNGENGVNITGTFSGNGAGVTNVSLGSLSSIGDISWGNFVFSSSPDVGASPYSVCAADVNGDGKVDLISANENENTLTVLTNDGSGGFAASGTYGVGSEPQSVCAADVNGDGKVDLISANENENTLTVLTNDGSGGFAASGTYGVGSEPQSVCAADVNGDGKVDLICANDGNFTLTVLTNNGIGGFVPSGTYDPGYDPVSVCAADVNGDGKVDLICANLLDNTLTVLLNTPVFSGAFTGNGAGLTSLTAANLTGALPALNGASLTNLNASQLTSGTIPLAQLPAVVVTNTEIGVTLSGTFSGNGSGLTSLNAANLTGALPGISGASLTALNASQLTSGTIPLAQLPPTSAFLNSNQTFTGQNNFSGNVGIGTNGPGELLEVAGGDATIRVRNLNDNAGGFIGDTYLALQLGMYNPTGTTQGVLSAGEKRCFFGISYQTGQVGSLSSDFGFGSPTFRNVLDDGSGNLTVSGKVGISTTSPAAILDVEGEAFTSGITGPYFGVITSNAFGVYNNSQQYVSIKSQWYIEAYGFIAVSDQRIKDIVGHADSAKDLATIERLKVTDYRMKDRLAAGDNLHKGFIAQEVQTVIPEAVTKTRNFIPDIYAVAQKLTYDKAAQTLRVQLTTVVKDAVRELTQKNQEVFVPLLHRPGEAQVDFGHALANVNGQLRKVAFFVMALPYSDATFVMAFERECTETFWEGHVRAFEFFKGVPTRITYDNTKVAVSKLLGKERRLTQGFLQLKSHYLFDHHFCRVARGNEKGVVEGQVKFTRLNYFVPVPQVGDMAGLNGHLYQRCQEDQVRWLRGQTGTKAQLLLDDQKAFLPLPTTPFEACRKFSTAASSLSLVRFDGNDYSVPVRWAHHPIVAKGYFDRGVLCGDGSEVARHTRIWEDEQVCFEPLHYLALLETKPGALDHARPLMGWTLPECFALLRRRLETERDGEGTREYIKVLRLLEKHSLPQLRRAVEQALAVGAITRDAVAQFLYPREDWGATLFSLDGHPHLRHVRVAAPNLASYMDLVGGVA